MKKFYVRKRTLVASTCYLIFGFFIILILAYHINKYLEVNNVDVNIYFLSSLVILICYQFFLNGLKLHKLYKLWFNNIPVISISDLSVKNNFEEKSAPIPLNNISSFKIEYNWAMFIFYSFLYSPFIVKCKEGIALDSDKYIYNSMLNLDNRNQKKEFYWRIPLLYLQANKVVDSINFYKNKIQSISIKLID